jgi:hypothetical protein
MSPKPNVTRISELTRIVFLTGETDTPDHRGLFMFLDQISTRLEFRTRGLEHRCSMGRLIFLMTRTA